MRINLETICCMYGIGEVGEGADCNQNFCQHVFKLQFDDDFSAVIGFKNTSGCRWGEEELRNIYPDLAV